MQENSFGRLLTIWTLLVIDITGGEEVEVLVLLKINEKFVYIHVTIFFC